MSDGTLWWWNNTLGDKPSLPIDHPMVAHGDGYFETMRVEAGAVPCFALHMDRLQAALQRRGLDAQAAAALRADAHFICDALPNADGRLKCLAVAQSAAWQAARLAWCFTPHALTTRRQYEEGLVVGFSDVPHPGAGAWGKSTSYQWGRIAHADAVSRGWHDALVSRAGFVVEGAIAGLLWREDETWFTTPAALGPLPSTTIAWLERSGVAVQRSPADRTRLEGADAVVLANALWLAFGVRTLGNRTFERPDEAAAPLRAALRAIGSAAGVTP